MSKFFFQQHHVHQIPEAIKAASLVDFKNLPQIDEITFNTIDQEPVTNEGIEKKVQDQKRKKIEDVEIEISTPDQVKYLSFKLSIILRFSFDFRAIKRY